MLYEISMFWDGRYAVTAQADEVDGATWVAIDAPGAAKTVIFTKDHASAIRLADLINELVIARSSEQQAA